VGLPIPMERRTYEDRWGFVLEPGTWNETTIAPGSDPRAVEFYRWRARKCQVPGARTRPKRSRTKTLGHAARYRALARFGGCGHPWLRFMAPGTWHFGSDQQGSR